MTMRNALTRLLLAATVLCANAAAANAPFSEPPKAGKILASVTRATQQLHTGIPVSVEVIPKPSQIKATNLITYFLSTFHYKDVPLNDELSVDVLKRYLNSLDPNHAFFLASDIETFRTYRKQLDDELKQADLSIPFAIFNVYLARVQERVDYALELLKQDFDFSRQATYQLDRSEAPWPEDVEAANDLWRKRIKNDILRLKLAGKEKEEIRETLRKRYKSLGERVAELDRQDAYQLFMNAYAQSIEPHTSYLSPRTSENFEIAMSLSLQGIGAVLQRDYQYTKVRRIVPGGPADKDGELKPGDRIVGVGQGKEGPMVNIVGWRLDDVVQLIRGPKGSVVRLNVIPAGSSVKGPPKTIKITRDKVELKAQTAEKSILTVESGGRSYKIGVIEVPTFYIDFAARAKGVENYRSTTRDVRKLLGQLKEANVDGVIIDLRGNGGGALIEAIKMTGLFIDRGPVVQVKSSSGDVEVERDTNDGRAWNGPLAVLVNRYSASASEIFTAAIQDYGRGVIIGESTYGKGTVQNLIDLSQFTANDKLDPLGKLKMTTAKFFGVDGSSTQVRGVTPDITFPTEIAAEETGESSRENALPWSAIEPADYDPVNRLEDVLAKAAAMHKVRVAHNEKFQEAIDEITHYYKEQEDTTVSLKLSVRREEFEEAQAYHEAASDSDESEAESSDDGADTESRSATTQATDEAADEKAGESGADAKTGAEETSDGGDGAADDDQSGDSVSDDKTDDANEKTEDGESEEAEDDALLKETARILADIIRLKNHDVALKTAVLKRLDKMDKDLASVPP